MSANIARHLDAMALAQPAAAAIKVPRGRTAAGDIDYLALSFAELAGEVGSWQRRLASRGLRRGDRVLVMVRPGLPLIAAVFALFKLGAVPVVIDPGMGLKAFLAAVARTRPRALVGIPLAQVVSRLFAGSFRSVEARVGVPGSLTARLGAAPGPIPPAADCAPADAAAILFTSGSTGLPKGVAYEHGMFEAQVRMIRDAYGIAPGEIDLPLLPIFALFNPALGMTSVIPEVDPRRPAAADPAKLVQAIRQEQVTNSFGSPTLWRLIADHCRARRLTLPSLRRVLCAGAPVPAALWEESRAFLPKGGLHSPYGATEALPLTSLSADEFRGDSAAAAGAPVGRPLPGIRIKIIAIEEGPIPSLERARELPAGEIGEIIAQGPVVTREYDGMPEATAAAKIPDPAAGSFWHRLGDCGFLDPAGGFWFCGRKVERVRTETGTLYTEPCERVFRGHPRAARCALIGLGAPGAQRPALVAETEVRDEADARALAEELRALARAHPATAAIARFYFRPRFPVDVRHNAKIHRLTLARWAGSARGYDAP
jgi:acyl-CoA synthetase (AMP-forming)/AMP-acid ligase II